MLLDLSFSLVGNKPIPADHGYALCAAISRLVPDVHEENGIAVHPIRGQLIGDRRLQLVPWSTLTLRVPDGQITPLLKLAGKSLQLNGTSLRVGVPVVRALVPATALRSRLVVIKVAHTDAMSLTEEIFKTAARKQLDDLGISKEATITVPRRERDNSLGRRTLRLKHKEIVGYEVLVEGLTAEESITLQERGIGGKRHMGCGVFVPVGGRATC